MAARIAADRLNELPPDPSMSDPSVFHLRAGHAPVLIVMPHIGTQVPADMADHMTEAASQAADSSWHLDRLYAFASELGASVLQARYSRHVVDPSPALEAPGGPFIRGDRVLVPEDTMRGEPLYRSRGMPDARTRSRLIQEYWQPFHACLAAELRRLRGEHGQVLLWEAHATASVLPGRFEGRRPAFCLGTNAGEACAEPVGRALVGALGKQDICSWVVNGRYNGGVITQRYGCPAEGVHAVALDICQASYMNEFPPYSYRADLAGQIELVLEGLFGEVLQSVAALARAGRGQPDSAAA